MTVYKVKKSYGTGDDIFYQVLPYNVTGTFKALGFIEFIKFILFGCKFSLKSAMKLADELNNRR